MKSEHHLRAILANLGIDRLNPMQSAAFDTIVAERDIVLLSPTGTGKTLAYLLPILETLDADVKGVQCLVVVPARELAQQIEQVWKQMGTGFKVNACYGGHAIATELNNLSSPPALLIGTPGRLCDHLDRQSFATDTIRTLVLDEFDKSLQLGFHEEMRAIVSRLPQLDKRVLLSATADVELPDFVAMQTPAVVDYSEADAAPALMLHQVLSPEKDKIDTLFHLICHFASEPALIFCNHREVTERIVALLKERGIFAGYYHGGMDQDDRERVLIQYRNGSLDYLVTTDLAARGLDIAEVRHVVHYHLPAKESDFTHRNGRTARMHATGSAYLIRYEGEALPDYIADTPPTLDVTICNTLPRPPRYLTLYISGGKKTKLNKSDIVGFFLQKGQLDKSALGLIEVKDLISFVAVRADALRPLLANISGEKMKGKKYKIEIARSVIKKTDV